MARMRFCPCGDTGAMRRSSSSQAPSMSPMPTSKPGISEPRSSVRQRIVGRARLFVTIAPGSYRLPPTPAKAAASQITPQADVLPAAWPDEAPASGK